MRGRACGFRYRPPQTFDTPALLSPLPGALSGLLRRLLRVVRDAKGLKVRFVVGASIPQRYDVINFLAGNGQPFKNAMCAHRMCIKPARAAALHRSTTEALSHASGTRQHRQRRLTHLQAWPQHDEAWFDQ